MNLMTENVQVSHTRRTYSTFGVLFFKKLRLCLIKIVETLQSSSGMVLYILYHIVLYIIVDYSRLQNVKKYLQ